MQYDDFINLTKESEPSNNLSGVHLAIWYAFKDNWKIWCDNNKDIIKTEIDILKGKGYEGDVLVKMYKSARYYFKNKSTEKKDAKKRPDVKLEERKLENID